MCRLQAGSEGINGTSLVAAMEGDASIKSAAFSQFSKDNVGTGVNPKYFRNQTQVMGCGTASTSSARAER